MLGRQEAGSGSGGAAERAAPARVGVAPVAMRRIDRDVSAIGTLRPARFVDVVATVSGRVTDLPIASGQAVEAGALLVRLDDRAVRADLVEATATRDEARQSFTRIERLSDRNTVAEAELEGARAALRRAEAAVMRARAALDDRTIRAPFAGVLGLVDIEPGALLGEGEVVTRLADLSKVELQAPIPERYFDEVAPGQSVSVGVPAYPGTRFEGEVTVRAPRISEASRSFDIRAEIDNPDRRLAGGMFADARLVLGTHDGVAVPDDAIIDEGLTTYVYRVSDGAAERVEVGTGASLGSATKITGGLADGERVVVAGWENLSDGDPIEIVEDIAREGLN